MKYGKNVIKSMTAITFEQAQNILNEKIIIQKWQ